MSKIQTGQVNKKVARLNAAWVLAFSLVFIIVPEWRWIVFVILANFLIKGFWGPWYSPISQINKKILSLLRIKPEMIFAPPKIFAAKVGFVISLMATIMYIINIPAVATVFISILAFFAFLELSFNFCMGCWVHSFFSRRSRSR